MSSGLKVSCVGSGASLAKTVVICDCSTLTLFFLSSSAVLVDAVSVALPVAAVVDAAAVVVLALVVVLAVVLVAVAVAPVPPAPVVADGVGDALAV